MSKRYHINEKQLDEINKAREENKDKNVERRLKAITLRAEGKSRAEIAGATGFAKTYITELFAKYRDGGLEAIAGNNYRGNRRNMSFDEEAAFLEEYRIKAGQGQVLDAGVIKKAYEEKVGHPIGGSQIYYVLRRHGWRKLMPRSEHPGKASDEAIEASKKLTTRPETKWQIITQKGTSD
jgi:transposase